MDDEPAVCTLDARLVRSAKMKPRYLCSVADFLSSSFSDENACVISDVAMPGTSGLELPSLLARDGHRLPVIFITARHARDARTCSARRVQPPIFGSPLMTRRCLTVLHGRSRTPLLALSKWSCGISRAEGQAKRDPAARQVGIEGWRPLANLLMAPSLRAPFAAMSQDQAIEAAVHVQRLVEEIAILSKKELPTESFLSSLTAW